MGRFAVCFLALFSQPAAAQTHFTKSVLILNSYRAGFAWTDELVRGVRAALEEQPYHVELFVEYMDSPRFFGEEHAEQLKRFYRQKYSGRKMDLVISSDDDALEFLLKHHEDLFGRAPVVFCGVNNPNLAASAPREVFTGVLEVFDSKAILNLALRLHPATKRVYIVTDNSHTSVSQRQAYEEVARNRTDLAFTFLDGRLLSLDEITKTLEAAPARSLVITTAFARDKTGGFFHTGEAHQRLARATRVPIYSPSTSVGQGFVAGGANLGYRHGLMAGRLGARVLHGERPSNVAVETDSENQFVFDFLQLKKRGLAESQLPPYSQVINRPTSFYENHRHHIWGGIAVIVLQGLAIFALLVNISRRKRAVQGQERLVAILEATTDFVGIADGNRKVLYLNRAGRRLLGIGPRELISDTTLPKFHPEWACKLILEEGLPRAQRDGAWFGETALLARDGREIPVSQVIIAHKDRAGAVSFFSTIARDIGERKEAEQALRASEQRFRTLVENLQAGVLVLNPQGEIQFVNKATLNMFGASEEEVLGIRTWAVRDKVFREDGSEFQTCERPVPLALATGQPVRDVVMGVDSGRVGRVVWLLVSAVPQFTPEGAVSQVIVSFVDISERKRAEEALRLSEEKFSTAFRSSPDSITISTLDEGRYLEVNEGYLRLTGYRREQVIGKTVSELKFWAEPEEREQLVSRLWQHGRVQNAEMRFRTKSGEVRLGLLSAEPMELRGQRCWLAVFRDITEQKRLEEQYLQGQKMEALGRLAGGVAHDFNNLLTVIQGYGEVLLRRLGSPAGVLSPGALRDSLEEILKAAERAASLTRQLLAFSRRQVLQPRILDLNAVVTDVVKMLRRMIGEDIELKLVLGENLASVTADPGLLQQVIMNLAVNARDAMVGGGKLAIATDNVQLGAGQHPEVPAGRYVRLAVADTGIGMDDTTRGRIFEPFFTTKEAGQGTGLGLATVHGIIRQSEGHITVESELGQGTTFSIYLPSVDEPPERTSPQTAAGFVPGSATILLVEDDKAVRKIARECLAEAGYSVLAASNGREALEICERETKKVDLLVTDVVLPGGSGPALAQQLKQIRPTLRVLYISGYAQGAITCRGAMPRDTALLEKPFRIMELTRKVREVLDQSGADGAVLSGAKMPSDGCYIPSLAQDVAPGLVPGILDKHFCAEK